MRGFRLYENKTIEKIGIRGFMKIKKFIVFFAVIINKIFCDHFCLQKNKKGLKFNLKLGKKQLNQNRICRMFYKVNRL